MAETTFPKELLDALARKLAVMDGQNPDGIYKVAGAPMPAWMGYRGHAQHVLEFLHDQGFAKAPRE